MTQRVVIVGTSIGGVRTAQALRLEGYTGDIVLVGAEADLPYDKPPLSKQFLTGDWDDSRVRLLGGAALQENRIELRQGTPAASVDLATRCVRLADGDEIGFETLVVATGARARPAPWRTRSGVHVLRTLSDARALRRALARTGPIVIVGGGFIGAEVAAAASRAGRPVTVIDPLPAPAERVVGPEVGSRLAAVHERHGVATRFGVGVEAMAGEEGALTVTLTDGQVLSADTVVVGIGAVPATEWLEGSGLLVDNGVVCRADCRTVEGDNVYAVGDCARWLHPRDEETVRVEHWTNAVEQAACVAHNIACPDDVRQHAPVEYVWSDQYDWKIQLAGRPGRYLVTEIIGDADGELPRFLALYRDDAGGLGGAVAVNWPRALITARRQIGTSTTFDEVRAAVRELSVPAAAR